MARPDCTTAPPQVHSATDFPSVIRSIASVTKPPLSVIVVSGLFIVAGSVGLVYHATKFRSISPFPFEVVWVCLVRLLAIVCGVFLLRGRNWARWGVIVWLAYHVVLSMFHSALAVVIHTLLLAVITYLLLRPRASAYFGARRHS
jgi:hypothetical protein